MNTKLFNSVDAGHTYELVNHETGTTQTLLFVKKKPEPAEGEPDRMVMVQEGTTNEAVISMLIDRMQVLNETMPSSYNEEAIKHLHLAFEALQARTADREERGVEGTHHE